MQAAFSFVAEQEVREAFLKQEKLNEDKWRYWKSRNWSGPAVGGYCSIGTPIVPLAEPNPSKRPFNGGDTLYAYMGNCRLLEELPDGRWIGEISLGIVNGEPFKDDGIKVFLKLSDMDPPNGNYPKLH